MVQAQRRGAITGTVSPATSGVVVIATNQVTSQVTTAETDAGGRFSLRLRPGAYRLSVEPPFIARFDKTKNYGEHVLLREDSIENVIVGAGKEAKIDFAVEKVKARELVKVPARVPLGAAGRTSVESQTQTQSDRREVRDRWRIGFPEYDRYGDKGGRGRDIPFRRGGWYDPYNQSWLKGDYPIFGNKVFMIFSAISSTTTELSRTPKPSDVSSARNGSAEFFGKPEQLAVNQIFQLTFEMFHGDSTYRPRDWAIKISPTFSLPNYLNARENGVVNIDVRRGTTRTDTQFSLEEAFVEKKIEDVGPNFDFVSLRVGIQPFVSDFRGFVFSDNNLGTRLFGSFDNNRYQYNVGYFAQLEKDTNSGLNRFDRRHQNVYVANIFRQDFIRKGYTIQASTLYNDDRRSLKYDRNGFLVRPALIGDVRPHAIKVGYVGINGDGHIGRLNLTHSYYYAFGHDERNPIAGRPVRVSSNMAAVEASIDHDYLRFRGAFFFAQGDKNPTDGTANGFDAIFDDPNFVGGQFSFWNRNGIRLTQTGVGLVQPNSILPSLRSSKIEGQANFVNPGIFIYNGGVDAEITHRIKAVFNVNYLRFHRTEPLEYVLFQNRIRHEIGWDLSLGVAYRPLLINNVTLTFGAATLKPGRGFRDIYTNANTDCPANLIEFCTSDSVNINPSKLLFNLFAQAKFVF
ncbi:MAG TPA: carboxypeptidase-like regulatory domain-containing protein [Pyrinomonadaceae bacterium]|nr:carboxypeptidase-like regulatory domain-containing protein [Pyrinomonadaceae bacterium]